ncbi:MAG: aminobenzoyl-glutamate transporter [Planctomyces sp.]|nr:aminobenzoyl-glutamate transporter [Planctomyces sp.]
MDRLERLGNRLPSPPTLFLVLALLVMAVSHVGAVAGWSVTVLEPRRVEAPAGQAGARPTLELITKTETVDVPVRTPDGAPAIDAATGKPLTERLTRPVTIRVNSLLTPDGLYYAISRMVWNFINFPPLGVVLAGILGVGLAERTGLIGAILRVTAPLVPGRMLTPMIVLLGIASSAASDAGYIVLPPLAAALYMAYGRSPVAGIAAAFAGVSGGFSANLFPTTIDPVVANLTAAAAGTVEPGYTVNPISSYYFLLGSAPLITLLGWFVTDRVVEPRLAAKSQDEGGPRRDGTGARLEALSPGEVRGLAFATVALVVVLGLIAAAVFVEGWPLWGKGPSAPSRTGGVAPVDRWTAGIVPILLAVFAVPGIAYGAATGVVRGERDVVKILYATMSDMGPIIVMSFFAAQFVEWFTHSQLAQMLAMLGAKGLAASGLPWWGLLIAIVAATALVNLLMGSLSAKYTILAPVLVPMMMLLGISPELTQTSYRVGDSVTNIITPLNSYMVIILAVVQRYAPRSGLGTMFTLMVPYSLVFLVAWTLFLLLWVGLGVPVGVDGPLWYGG